MSRLHGAVTVFSTVLIGLGCSACGHDASSPDAAASTHSATAGRSTVSSQHGEVPPPPKAGQCRNPTRDFGPGDFVDQTPVIPCSKPHTLETVEVIRPVEKLTLAQVKQLAGSCDPPAVNYLGIPFPAVWTLSDRFVSWPSAAQRAAGQNWLRCDVGVIATTGCCQLAPQTGSLRGAVASDPVRFQMCLDQIPEPFREQPLVSCKTPHRTEALLDGLEWNVTQYPSAAALDKHGESECAKLVSRRKGPQDLVVTPDWQSSANWSGGTLFGRCWIHRHSGLLPPNR
jgi:hypothetical protein